MAAETTAEKLGLKKAGSPGESSLATARKAQEVKTAAPEKTAAVEKTPATEGAEKPSLLRSEKPVTPVEPKVEKKPEAKVEPKVEAKTEAPKTEEPKVETKTEEKKPDEKTTPVLEYTLKAPEGSSLDAAAVEEIEAFAKARGFSKEQADAVLAREGVAQRKFTERQTQEYIRESDGWVEILKKHPVVGGDKLEEIDHRNAVFIEKRAPGLMKVLRATGLGKQPDFFLWVHELEKGSRDDRIPRQGDPPAGSGAPPKYEDRYKRGPKNDGGGA